VSPNVRYSREHVRRRHHATAKWASFWGGCAPECAPTWSWRFGDIPQAIELIGGREGIRTPDPLLAKRAVENTKWLRWCRLHEKSAKFPLLKCTEVVPNPMG